MQIAFVLFVLVGAVALFASERFRLDLVGFMALTLLLLGGVLTVPEALAGFADPGVHMIGALFVVGAAVFETGLADRFGMLVERFGGGSERRLLLSILVASASLSAFLSSTGTVALMIPVVMSLARRAQISPSKLMIPLAYATLLGGLLTLIATAPNLVVSTALEGAGRAPFGFFSFTGPGLCLLAGGILYMVFLGPKLIPDRMPASERQVGPTSADDLWNRYGLDQWIVKAQIRSDSPLVGKTISESAIRSEYGVVIFGVRGPDAPSGTTEQAMSDRILRAGDTLTLKGAPSSVSRFCERASVQEIGRPDHMPRGIVVAELLVPPSSALIGKTVQDSRLRSRFGVTVMAIFRSTDVLRDSVALTTVHVGDLLLVMGTASALMKMRDELGDVLFVNESEELKKASFRTHRAPHTLGIVLVMLSALSFELAPPVTVVVTAALAMVLSGALDANAAERSIKWESLLLIATFLPMTTALTKVGVIDLVVRTLVGLTDGASPYFVMAIIFAVTSLIGVFISNTATAVLVSPIATEVASGLQIRPEPLLMAVAVACSAAFLTPVSSPVNLLVVNPGSYRFADFARYGAPLLLLSFGLTLAVVPLFFPFR